MCNPNIRDIIDIEQYKNIRANVIIEQLRQLDEVYKILSYIKDTILQNISK